MSLEDDLASIVRNPTTFEGWLRTADPDRAELVLSYMRDPDVSANALIGKLRKNGIPVSKETVEAYRGPRE